MSAGEASRYAAQAARAAEEARAALRELSRHAPKGVAPTPAAESRRRAAAKRLAKLFAGVLTENRSLRRGVEAWREEAAEHRARAGAGGEELRALRQAAAEADALKGAAAENAFLRQELAEASDAVTNMMLKLAKDRRRWKAALLSVRRRLLTMKPPQPAAAERVAALELELAESQEVAAGLMVEVARAQRGAKAQLLGEQRFRRRVRKQGVVGGSERARDAFAEALDARLRALADSPSADPDQLVKAAEDARRLARGVALAGVAATPPRPERGDARATLEKRLDSWEAACKRRGAPLLRSLEPRWPAARMDEAAFVLVVDSIIAAALERSGKVGAVVVKGGPVPGGLQVEFSDGGSPIEEGAIEAARASAAVEGPGLALFLARVVLRAWGGDLVAAPGAKGRGSRVTLSLLSADKGKEL